MRPKYTKVRARSANEGSGTVGWSFAAPVPACFLIEEEDIAVTCWQFKGNQTWSKRGGAREVAFFADPWFAKCSLRAFNQGLSGVRSQKSITASVWHELGVV